jgi:hypothetical protein
MFASLARRTYKLLTLLYPAEFRREHRDDMVLVFDELLADRGLLAATSRTSIDLVVTVPRYQLEAVMSESHATQVLTTAIAGLLILGFASVMVALPWAAPVLILAGLGLALANRGRLARAIRTPDPSRRGRMLRMSALSAGVFVACVIAYFIVIWDEEASTPGLLIPSLLGTFAMFGAVGFLVAALSTPRTEIYPGAP